MLVVLQALQCYLQLLGRIRIKHFKDKKNIRTMDSSVRLTSRRASALILIVSVIQECIHSS